MYFYSEPDGWEILDMRKSTVPKAFCIKDILRILRVSFDDSVRTIVGMRIALNNAH